MKGASRMRVFAGPNGSGKSTIKEVVSLDLLGHYLNPDELEGELRQHPFFKFSRFSLPTPEAATFQFFFTGHPLAIRADLSTEFKTIQIQEDTADFSQLSINSYVASILTDWLRTALIQTGQSFTFETVMSSSDKLDVFRRAKDAGFRTYLYYIATDDPQINVERVSYRILTGGHSVPPDKIVERYYRSLDLLLDAIRLTDRAYIFDNSGTERVWLAEVTGGVELELQSEDVPEWFTANILDKISPLNE
ncbi:hypothetical protein EXU85_19740 [Spirosoma sp. KCTC 42546]|uniref:zeta toxin family protein n=1 Tax=Spirosoma sp. KCTC 42546 TaxID=2520506 RepID=UPI00115B0C6E|nr:zeta toxin family protein [Spirosoma sp. KCTC 42546]QDK80718.1 hypothetical protein EXU85_19740 [Spirosoma sp. KCTC 42546]